MAKKPKEQDKSRKWDRDEAKSWLEKIVYAKQEMDEKWDQFSHVCGAAVESPLGMVCWNTFEMLISIAEECTDDELDVIAWFVNENECGSAGKSFATTRGRYIPRNVDDLLDLLGYRGN